MEKESLVFSLGIDNLKNVPFHKYESDFTFVVNGERYETTRYVADLLSPAIRQMHFTDKSIDEFSLNIKNLNDSKKSPHVDYFNDFLNLATFHHFTIDSDHQKYYMEYFYNLGNIDEYTRIRNNYFSELTTENAVEILISLIDIYSNIPQEFNLKMNPIKDVIDFVSNNFEEINKEELKKLNFEIIEEIIQSNSLRLNNESSLLDFILSLYEYDHSFCDLFEYVQFRNVSEESLISFIDEFEIEDLNQNIWNSICARLLPKSKEFALVKVNSIRYVPNFIEFKPEEGKEFNGIIHFLSDQLNSNLVENKIIEISSNSILSEVYHPNNLIDYKHNNYYHSKDNGDAFVLFDFKDKLVQIKNYSIKSMNNFVHYSHLRNWVLEVSSDKESWKIIDSHVDDDTLNGPGITVNFAVKKKDNNFHRFVRIRQPGTSWDPRGSHNFIGFYFIEFFGRLILNNENENEEEEEEQSNDELLNP